MIHQIRQTREFITRRVVLSVGIASAVLIGVVTFASTYASTAAAGSSTASANGVCSQAAVVVAEGQIPVLDPSGASGPIPAGEPTIVAMVQGKAVTAQQLETLVTRIEQNHQDVLAHIPGSDIPAALKAVLLESHEQVRQRALTSLIEHQLWLADGQARGLSASSAQASDAAERFGAAAVSDAAISDSRTRFQAYLCANHLSAAAFSADPRVIQSFQANLTITAAKSAVVSAMVPSEQQDQDHVVKALAAHVKALWTADSVHVFLPGFMPVA